MATVFWRVGMRKFSGTGIIIPPSVEISRKNSYVLDPDRTVSFDPEEMFKLRPYWWAEEDDDWRNT